MTLGLMIKFSLYLKIVPAAISRKTDIKIQIVGTLRRLNICERHLRRTRMNRIRNPAGGAIPVRRERSSLSMKNHGSTVTWQSRMLGRIKYLKNYITMSPSDQQKMSLRLKMTFKKFKNRVNGGGYTDHSIAAIFVAALYELENPHLLHIDKKEKKNRGHHWFFREL